MQLDVNLQVWIEPVSGTLVKYEDNTIAYYYDIKSGKRLHPWNKFRNRYTDTSLKEHVRLAQREKWKILGIDVVVPATLAFGAIMVLVLELLNKSGRRLRDVAVYLMVSGFWGTTPASRRRYFIAATLLLLVVISVSLSLQKQKQLVVGVATWGANPDYERNIVGFKEALAAKGYQGNKNVRFLQRNAETDIERQREIIESFVREDVSLIYSLNHSGDAGGQGGHQDNPNRLLYCNLSCGSQSHPLLGIF